MEKPELRAKVVIDNPWEDLVLSLLSVNQYSLKRTYESIESLRDVGIFDPENISRWAQSEFIACLTAGGCDRGTFMTNLFALRLAHLGALIQRKGIDACTKIISGRDGEAIEELLMPVNGIGPKVIANFFLLREIPRK